MKQKKGFWAVDLASKGYFHYVHYYSILVKMINLYVY